MSETDAEHRSVVIIGSGIAGLSAAIYTGRAGHNPLVIHGREPGGQLTLTTEVANYPGFPDPVSGPELVNRMNEQAEQFGTDFRYGGVDTITKQDSRFHITLRDGTRYTADSVIAASGASARTLDIPGEDELMGFGVSTCATCDGAFFQGEDMVVVGGGDAACEEAVFLTKFAETVYLVHRREEFRAEQAWVDEVQKKVDSGEIELVLNSEVESIQGEQQSGVKSVSIITHPDGHPTAKLDDPATSSSELDVGAVFVAIGHTPNTQYLEGVDVSLDEDGYLDTDGDSHRRTETHVSGLFGAGDVTDNQYQQAATASGSGVKAALDADAYLSSR